MHGKSCCKTESEGRLPGKDHEDLELLSLVAKNTINAVIITDANNLIVWVNEGFTRMTGYAMEEAIGRSPGDLLQGWGSQTSSTQFMAEKRKMGETFECEILNYRKDGTPFWMKMQAQPVYNDAGKVIKYFGIGTDITYEKELHELLLQSKIEAQKKISRAMLQAQETERCQIGRELHDNVNQMLASINLYLGYMMDEGVFNADVIVDCRTCLKATIEEIRQMTKKLVSPVSKTISLRASIEELTGTLGEISKIDISMDMELLDESILTQSCKQNIFRMIQEQLNNIVKYAKASEVRIGLFSDAAGTYLIVADNGRGFDITTCRKGSGLINIMYRAESFNGHAEFISSPGEGCVLHVRIPKETNPEFL